MKEKDIEKKFRTAVAQAGGKAFKFVSPGNAGVPDRLVVIPGGRIGFVELKRPGEKPRADQRLQIRRLQELGCFACTLDDPGNIPGVIAAIRLCNSEKDTALVLALGKERGLL